MLIILDVIWQNVKGFLVQMWQCWITSFLSTEYYWKF
uniref:Sister chromatid cohesion protein PDS5 homolog A n=1 Tax=Rhizophora mucronata TaxID=61149 RepID=A0A2P2LSP4_RHIMU